MDKYALACTRSQNPPPCAPPRKQIASFKRNRNIHDSSQAMFCTESQYTMSSTESKPHRSMPPHLKVESRRHCYMVNIATSLESSFVNYYTEQPQTDESSTKLISPCKFIDFVTDHHPSNSHTSAFGSPQTARYTTKQTALQGIKSHLNRPPALNAADIRYMALSATPFHAQDALQITQETITHQRGFVPNREQILGPYICKFHDFRRHGLSSHRSEDRRRLVFCPELHEPHLPAG